ncbi:MAG: PIG-L deacetylase family protein [Byssovorax sp.]
MRGAPVAARGDTPLRSFGLVCGLCALLVSGCGCSPGDGARSAEPGGFVEPGDCAGGDRGLPIDPRSGEPICDVGSSPAVFFSAHPDDESIGMAGAILEARAAGRLVFIELMTHGEKSAARARLDDGLTDTWHPGIHHHPMSEAAFGEARVREMRDAAVRLGVTGVVINDFPNGALTRAEVLGRIETWLARGLPCLSLAGTAGPQDPTTAGGEPHPDHIAVWDALIASGHPDVRGFLVYDHGHHAGHPNIVVSIAPYCAQKAFALDAYRVWAPQRGRYGVGFHSVRTLIEIAQEDCIELVVTP